MARKAEFKDRLREAMASRGMKAVELSMKTGVPKSAISFYLAGKSEPKTDRHYIIAKALDVSEAWLMGYDVAMERAPTAKKNDRLAELVVRMRRDSDFFSMVSDLADLPQEQYESIKSLLAAFAQK